MRKLILGILLLICVHASAQIGITHTKLSKPQEFVIQHMGSGDRLYKTLIGFQLITEDVYEGQKIYDSQWIHKATFRALLKRKLIEQADKNRKNKGYGEYILTEKGEELNHNISS